MGVTFKGTDSFNKRTKELEKRIANAAAGAVYLESCAIMRLAKENTPVDTADLKGSGFVTRPDSDGVCEIGFGGPAAEYAVKVHEDMMAKHAVGGAKFLERAMQERAPNAAANMTEFARRILEGNGEIPGKASDIPTTPWEGK